MYRAYKYRCYPNHGTKRQIWRTMKHGVTPVWNACVAEREEAKKQYKELVDRAITDWVMDNKRDIPAKVEKEIRKSLVKKVAWPSAYSQYKHCSHTVNPHLSRFSSKMLQCTTGQVDGSEKSYREQRKKGDSKARPPKQKFMHRSIMYRQSGWYPKTAEEINAMDVPAVTLTKLGRTGQSGRIRIKLHRPIEGRIKAVSLTQKNGRYYICFSCELDDFSGACGPIAAPKSGDIPDLRQKHTSTGGSDPKKGGAHNFLAFSMTRSSGGSDPKKGGAHNDRSASQSETFGGSDPKKGGAHNRPPRYEAARPGGSDPKKGVVIEFLFWSGKFLRDSDGLEIPFPEFYWRDIEKLRELSRQFSAKKNARHEKRDGLGEKEFRGRNRLKAKRRLARWHEHKANKRLYWIWHVVGYYVANYRRIVIPKWPIKKEIEYALTNKDARTLCDGSYGKFVKCLKQKAGQFGVEVIEVKDERYEQEIARLLRVKENEDHRQLLRETRKAVKHDQTWRFAYIRHRIKNVMLKQERKKDHGKKRKRK